jgi:hypothetical protein
MPLHIQNSFCPIVLCDHCAEPIADAAASSALWLEPSRAKLGPHRIYFIHDACHSAFEQTAFTEAERSRVARTDLAAFLTHLSANTRVASEPQIKAQLLERISSRLATPKVQRPIPDHDHASSVR